MNQRHLRLSVLFAVTSFLGSALIFIVEPMFAKMVLPLLGGTPAVWNTCLVFFQAALLAGYGYAHLTTTRLTARQQVLLHGVLLLLASLTLPVAVPAGWTPPADTTPIFWLVLVLAVGLGAPFLIVSATAPLLQKWFAGTDHPSAKDPYFLYSASNVGSILALLSYPLVIEPASPLPQQSRLWTVGYLIFGMFVLVCAVASMRRATVSVASADAGPATEPTTWTQRADWIVRSFVPSSLLLGVTTYVSTDIAAVPLLWTIPLTLYLLSFVLAFAPAPLAPPRLVTRAMPLLISVLALFIAIGVRAPVRLLVPLHLVTFFVCALHLHTSLASRRPDTRHLTEFYLWIAFGGVLGGCFNTFVAPLVFKGIVEYPVALVLACALQRRADAPADQPLTTRDFALPLALGIITAASMYAFATQWLRPAVWFVSIAVITLWCFSFKRKPVRFGLAIGMMLLASGLYHPELQRLLLSDRSFFGVLRVHAEEAGGRHVLIHGSTVHGEQRLDPARRREPLTYFHRNGPIGQALAALSPRLRDATIGVVGLGAGSLAAYATPGQRWTFYEIDPAVARIAQGTGLFTYLDDCGSACTIVLGDARLSLARPSTPTFRLLVLDAFSSDAIPVHLMTREAFDLYLRRLEPNGAIAFHISNRHLQLRPVLAALAKDRGLVALAQRDPQPADAGHDRLPSEWFLMARTWEAFGPLVSDARWERPIIPAGTRIWTDDYSDILAVLHPY